MAVPAPIGNRSLRRLAAAVLLVAGSLAPHLAAVAQQATTQEATTQEAAAPKLTIEKVDAQLKQIQEATALDEATRTKAGELYTGALEQLRLAQEWAQKAAESEKARQDAPQMLKDIETELAAAPAEPQPVIPEGASLGELEQSLASAEAELAASRSILEELQNEPTRRADRRKQVPELLAAVSQRLQEAEAQQAAPAAPGEPAEIAEARRTQVQTRIQALQAEKDAYEKELLSYDARSKLLTLRQDRAVRKATQDDKLVKAWRDVVSRARQEETQRATAEASEALLKAGQASPVVRDFAQNLASENEALVKQRTGPDGLARKIEKATQKREEVEEQLGKVTADLKDLKAKVETAGLNNAIGLLLRNTRRGLPNLRLHRRNLRDRNDVIADIQFEQFPFQEQRTALADVEGIVTETLDELAPSASEGQQKNLARILRELLTTKRTYLDALLSDYTAYLDLLLKLQMKEQQLADKTDELAAYIDERVLWVRSADTVQIGDFTEAWATAWWFLAPRKWNTVRQTLQADLLTNAALYALALLVFVILFAARRRLIRRIVQAGEEAQKRACISFNVTFLSLVITLAISAIGPAVLGFVAWRLAAARLADDFGRMLGSGVAAMALVLLTVEIPRQAIRKGGLAQAHFDWPAAPLRTARSHVLWLLAVALVAVFVITAIEAGGDETRTESLGRLTFVVAMLAFGLFARVLMRPAVGPIAQLTRPARDGHGRKLQDLLYVVAVGVPVTLALLACAGYFYTALRLSWRFHITLFFAVSLFILRGLLVRWLMIERRRLAREQARKRREALKAQSSAQEAEREEQGQEPELDLVAIDTQTQSLLRSVMVFSLIVGVWVIWADVLPALGILKRVELWHTVEVVTETVTNAEGQPMPTTQEEIVPITLAHVGLAILIASMAWMVVRNLPGLLEIALLQRLPMGAGERYAITTVLRYVIIITGIVLTFNAIGVGWGKVQWLVAAMGVGLGFGLQEIFANFVSGIIILFERPIRLGDTVTIGSISGTVTQIRMRATRITDWDRKELIVPNKEFVTGQLINWTLSDQVLRVIIPVGIAYGSDTQKAFRVLHQVAKDHPLVLADPGPKVLFLGFGSSSLDFELRVYVPNIDSFLQVKHELHMAIDHAFREADIEIAFPQQDIHVRSIEAALPLIEEREESQD